MDNTPVAKRAFLGLCNRRERWGLSRRGWLTSLASALAVAVLFLGGVYPFLAVTKRVPSDFLVVEGWVHRYAIRAGAQEFRKGAYQRVFATGGPVSGLGHYVNDFQTSASVGADLLKAEGLSADVVQMVPSHVLDRDRTYSSALALRTWFREHNLSVQRVNVVTENVHARRTRLLFEKAFGGEMEIGIIAVPSPDYDARRWWRYSEGVKEVISESAVYLYARLLFHPD